MLTPLVCRVTTVWQFATIVYFRLLYNIYKDFSSVLGKVVFVADGDEGATLRIVGIKLREISFEGLNTITGAKFWVL